MRRLALLAPAAGVLHTGCLASKGDIRLLQDDLAATRTQQQQAQAQADAARKAQLDSALANLARLNDTVRALSARFMSFQANTGSALYDMGRQLITLQEQAGLSQRRLQELGAQLEQRNDQMMAGAAPVTPGAPADSSKPAGPGPAQMFQLAYDQLRRGSYGTARAAFQDYLQRFPKADGASSAQLYIGQAYAAEGNAAAADSVYQLVVATYAKSPDAATALYKYGLSQVGQGKVAPGRAALLRVVRDYPGSPEAGLAQDRLRTLPPQQ
jgi:tol-pal system protein YbgF